ncbi:MAG TPA: hypothetical protein VKR52_13550 [Terracidiphilus sp.]|nr:hypothetical protein [Terracidiphilus sp.]
MKLVHLFLCGAAAAALAMPSFPQQTSPGYHAVACFKVKPDSAAAFREFAAGETHKIAQGRVDDGELTAWYLLRAVYPQGESSDCDYLVISIFPKLPHTLGTEQLDAAIKKAGLKITPEDYIKHRDAVTRLVSVAIFQNRASAGSPKKGDYFQVNYMKVSEANIDDWVVFEKTIWQPIAEALVKDGKENGWSLNVAAMPFGTDLPYQGVTVDVFPSMDAVFADDPQFADRFRKVHPDMELGTTFERAEKLRSRSLVRLFVLDDIVTAQ